MSTVTPLNTYKAKLHQDILKHKGKRIPKHYYSIELVDKPGSLLFVEEKVFEIFQHENIFDEAMHEYATYPNYYLTKKEATAALKTILKVLKA